MPTRMRYPGNSAAPALRPHRAAGADTLGELRAQGGRFGPARVDDPDPVLEEGGQGLGAVRGVARLLAVPGDLGQGEAEHLGGADVAKPDHGLRREVAVAAGQTVAVQQTDALVEAQGCPSTAW